MSKREYLRLAMTMPSDYLRECINNPSPYMRPIHVAILKIALRHKAKMGIA